MEPRPNIGIVDHSLPLDKIAPTDKPSDDLDPIVDTRKDPESVTMKQQASAPGSSTHVNYESDPNEKGNTTKRSPYKAQMSSKRTPKKWTLEHLLHNPNSELTKCTSLKERIDYGLLNLLPQDDLDELCQLLPPADINFIKYHEDEEFATEVVAQSLEEYNGMSTMPDTHFPIISSRFVSPEFTRTVEDFQILLSHGYYELEVPKEEEQKKPAGRKRKQEVAEEDLFKDEHYEAYWGERMKKRKDKRGRK